jgi:hypothetical protein
MRITLLLEFCYQIEICVDKWTIFSVFRKVWWFFQSIQNQFIFFLSFKKSCILIILLHHLHYHPLHLVTTHHNEHHNGSLLFVFIEQIIFLYSSSTKNCSVTESDTSLNFMWNEISNYLVQSNFHYFFWFSVF